MNGFLICYFALFARLAHRCLRNSSIHVSKDFAITSATMVIMIERVESRIESRLEYRTIGITPATKMSIDSKITFTNKGKIAVQIYDFEMFFNYYN